MIIFSGVLLGMYTLQMKPSFDMERGAGLHYFQRK